MASFPFDVLLVPISEELPCGPDLELEGDPEFMRFQAQIEGVLPASFLSFDRKDAGLAGHVAAAGALLKRSADIRVLCDVAKIFILDRDLGSFSTCIEALAAWIGERWDNLHPALLDGDPVMRKIALRSLDDNPHTVMPLQVAPLFKSRRLGAMTLRSFLLADGTVKPRAGFEDDGDEAERVPTAGDLASAIKDADTAEVMQARDNAHRLAAALDAIETLCDERSGQYGAVRLPLLKATVAQLVAVLDKTAAIKDPSLVVSTPPSEEGQGDTDAAYVHVPGHTGNITSPKGLVMALQAAALYFARHEPSSPVRMLLAQSEALIGKSFYDALNALAPELVMQAMIRPARELSLSLPLERLAALLPEIVEEADDEPDPSADESLTWQESQDQQEVQDASETPDDAPGSPDDGPGMDMDDAAAGLSPGETDAGSADTSPDQDARQDTGQAAASGAPAAVKAGGPPVMPVARTRQQALDLLDGAAAFLRQTEPSSPIPFILEHAKVMAGRDFVTLLRELLPAQVLRVDDD